MTICLHVFVLILFYQLGRRVLISSFRLRCCLLLFRCSLATSAAPDEADGRAENAPRASPREANRASRAVVSAAAVAGRPAGGRAEFPNSATAIPTLWQTMRQL
jgi:hypothetical protein